MNTTATLLHDLVAQYQARALNNGEGLLPPAHAPSISKTEQMLGFSLPESLRMVYAVFGGQEYIAPGITGIFGSHRLHSPSEIA
jgi:cell wall assembly regulator SMI1